jgi:Tfp pilus assembly protein PilO
MKMKEINLVETFYQHKNKVINTAIFLLAVLFSRNIYQQQLRVADSYRQREEIEVKKNAVLEDIRQLEKKIQAYKNFVNRKDISVAMNIMSEIAQVCSINVISIRPGQQKEYPSYVRHFFDLKLEANNYHSLGEFVSKLESRSELYSVEHLEIIPVYSSDKGKRLLSVGLDVSTILLKD